MRKCGSGSHLDLVWILLSSGLQTVPKLRFVSMRINRDREHGQLDGNFFGLEYRRFATERKNPVSLLSTKASCSCRRSKFCLIPTASCVVVYNHSGRVPVNCKVGTRVNPSSLGHVYWKSVIDLPPTDWTLRNHHGAVLAGHQVTTRKKHYVRRTQ